MLYLATLSATPQIPNVHNIHLYYLCTCFWPFAGTLQHMSPIASENNSNCQWQGHLYSLHTL